MRTLRLLVMLLPTIAFGGWRSLGTLTGTPQDVVVADGGVVVASFSTATGGVTAFAAQPDGGVAIVASLSGSYVGAGLLSNGCLVGLDSAANASYSPPACGTAGAVGGSAGQRLRVVNAAYPLSLTQPAASFAQLRFGSTAAVPWASVGSQFGVGTSLSMQALTLSGVDYVVAGRSTASYSLSIDGGVPIAVGSTVLLKDLSPFERGGVPSLVAVPLGGVGNGLLMHTDVRSATEVVPTVPAGLTCAFVGMATGAALVTTGQGQVLSPLPDPSNVAMTWRARNGAPPLMTGRANCLDARWCAAIDSTNGVWLYENAAPPTLVVLAASADAGATIRLGADAGDPDGDPLFLTWDGGVFAPVAGSEDGFVVDFTVPANAACGPLPIDVTARDGLHLVNVPASVEVVGHGVLQTIAPPTPATVAGPPVTFSAFIDGGCDSATFSWSSSDGQSGTGAQFNWTPPSTQCTPATVSITATATWARGSPVTSTSVESVMLTPWGRSETPSFTSPVTQLGGTTRIWSPTDSQHACASTMTFPGTELVWDPIAPSQSMVTPLDGGLLVVASECISEQLVATARRRVVGQSILSDAGTLTVDVQANVPPLGASAAFTLVADAGPGLVTGELGLTASCLPQRTTSAVVSVFDGTTLVNSDTFDASGPFSLTVPGGCAGGTRLVVAKLFEDGGFTGAQTQQSVELLDVPVAVGAQSVSQVVATCGEGVHTRVSLAPVDGTCMATETSWQLIAGAPVVTTSGTGTTFDLQTSSTDFSSAGTQFVIEWGVDAGGSKQVTERRTIDVGVAPFIEVSTLTTPALRREEAALEFDVSLRNTTPCAVDGLSLQVPLSGATPVLESVLVDGVKTSARLDSSILVLDGVSVAGGGVVHVRLAARPRMLGTAAAAPVASLNGLIVSMDAPTSTPTSCGCTTAPASAWLIVAGLIVLTRRRRRAE